jgi:hypothetical protein
MGFPVISRFWHHVRLGAHSRYDSVGSDVRIYF